MKKRIGDTFMPVDAFGRSLPDGIGLNLLVADLEAEIAFCRDVLAARLVYGDPDFAVFHLLGSIFLLHADHTYADHEFRGVFQGVAVRGAGAELRAYGLDPDAAETRANDAGAIVLAGSIDKPHGMRECHLVSPAGYVWVPSRRIG